MDNQELVRWFVTCLTTGFYISLISPFFSIFRGKLRYENAPIFVIVISYINCFIWIIYGNMISSNQIIISNIIGGISSLTLIFIYLIYEIKKYLIDSILNISILILGTIFIYKILIILIKDAKIIEKICITTRLFAFISPIQLVYRVIKENNYILIPILTSYISFLSCIFSVLYGFFIKDIYVVIIYSLGILLALVQFYVYSYYKRKNKNFDENNSTIDFENYSDEYKKDVNSINIDEKINEKLKEKPVKIILNI